MNREDAHKLLGGYATGTLTDAEREALFAAALEDQELFEALMKEEPLREAIADPATRDVMLRALERPPARPWWQSWRPLAGALAMAGLVLGSVAVWRASRPSTYPASAPVIVAEAPPPKPPAVIEPQLPPAPAPKAERRTKIQPSAAPASPAADALKAKDAVTETVGRMEADAATSSRKAEAPAATQQAAAPSPAPPQQQSQFSPQSVAVQTAPLLDRAVTATNNFRAASGAAVSMDKKIVALLSWTILRGDVEAPPDTILDAAETVRLRVFAQMSGELSVRDGDKILATGQAEPGQPLDLGPIPPTPHELQFVVTRPNTVPFRVRFALRYAQ